LILQARHPVNDMWDAIEFIHPTRIGHGVQAAYDKPLMKELAKRKIVLEICPMSNIATKAIENEEELRFILRTFIENNILFTINTDWPEMIEHAHLRSQFQFLKEKKMLSEQELKRCAKIAFAATFVPKGGLSAYL
jgi:adenosine deaminase